MSKTYTARGRIGFTLVELLITIGMMAILIALLLPSLARARRQARIVACASNMRQIVLAMTNYAFENESHYPTMDTPQTGGNLWDVSHEFYNALIKQGLTHEMFFCPAVQDRSTAEANFSRNFDFYIVDYNVWTPRLNGPDIIPPSQNYMGSRFRIVQPRPSAPFAGPAKVGDALAIANPMITDFAASDKTLTPPADADATLSSNPYGIDPSVTNHMDGSRLLGVNEAFADGHVAMNPPSAVKPYYLGESWNWR